VAAPVKIDLNQGLSCFDFRDLKTRDNKSFSKKGFQVMNLQCIQFSTRSLEAEKIVQYY
jgi:hypothetical protein